MTRRRFTGRRLTPAASLPPHASRRTPVSPYAIKRYLLVPHFTLPFQHDGFSGGREAALARFIARRHSTAVARPSPVRAAILPPNALSRPRHFDRHVHFPVARLQEVNLSALSAAATRPVPYAAPGAAIRRPAPAHRQESFSRLLRLPFRRRSPQAELRPVTLSPGRLLQRVTPISLHSARGLRIAAVLLSAAAVIIAIEMAMPAPLYSLSAASCFTISRALLPVLSSAE